MLIRKYVVVVIDALSFQPLHEINTLMSFIALTIDFCNVSLCRSGYCKCLEFVDVVIIFCLFTHRFLSCRSLYYNAITMLPLGVFDSSLSKLQILWVYAFLFVTFFIPTVWIYSGLPSCNLTVTTIHNTYFYVFLEHHRVFKFHMWIFLIWPVCPSCNTNL